MKVFRKHWDAESALTTQVVFPTYEATYVRYAHHMPASQESAPHGIRSVLACSAHEHVSLKISDDSFNKPLKARGINPPDKRQAPPI